MYIISIKKHIIFTIVFCLLGVFNCIAQDAYTVNYLTKEFKKIDKNRSGTIDQKESRKRWAKIESLDINNDGDITLEEYLNKEISVLATKGEKRLNILYKETAEEDLYLDIYYPNQDLEAKKVPVVIYTHGGGWILGSKENIAKPIMKTHFLELIEKGYAVVSVNYRLTRYKTVGMRDCVIDAMDAVRYLSKHQKELHLDANNFYVMGDSAGGQIAQMVTLADPQLFKGDEDLFSYSYKIKAGVSWYGPGDFTKVKLFETDDASKNPDRFGERILRNAPDKKSKKELYEEMSPVYYLSKDSPPLYIMAADNDTTIPVAHAYHIKKEADCKKANVELFIVKNAGHNWREAGGEIEPTLQIISQKTVDFILAN